MTVATVTYNLCTESNAGMDGTIQWQSVFLLNDGRICSFGTGNHAPNQSNAMRIIDPVAAPPAVSTYDAFPWTQNISPPGTSGTDLYVSNYDNHPSIYLPSENKAVWCGHGVFDFVTNTWTHGDVAPSTLNWNDFVSDPTSGGMKNYYNPATDYSYTQNQGIFFGNSAGGTGFGNRANCLIRNPAGSAQPWKIVTKVVSGISVPDTDRARHNLVCLGDYMYIDGGGARYFYKIYIPTMTWVETLTPYTPYDSANEYFPQFVYDKRRRKIVVIGMKLLEYDVFGTKTWTDITPAGWQGYQSPMGVYHPKLDAIFFRGIPFSAGIDVGGFKWNRITFDGASSSNYRQLTIDTNACPFKGPPESSFGGCKHVFFQWHPTKRRVYTWGGDYGVGADNFGQPSMGASFITLDPVSPHTYNRDSSLCSDQYSIDPYATGTIPWRLEHPYLPRNLGGTREVKPPRSCQIALVWDPVRSKFWGINTKIRTEFLYLFGGVPDLWANGDMTTTGLLEPLGTYSWLPGASGSPGTWTFETDAMVACRSGTTSYVGNVLQTAKHDERIACWTYDPTTDRVFAWGLGAVFIFIPSTKTFEWRNITPAGFSYFNSCSSLVAIFGDWMYGVALTSSGGVRHSDLIRVNIRNMLAVANGGTITDNSTGWQRFQLPWSLSPGFVWESNNDASAKWQEHAGVVCLDNRIVVFKSYDHLFEDGLTKAAVFDPGTLTFLPGDDSPDAGLAANSWIALPETGEILFGQDTSGYTNLKLWAYSALHGAGVSTPLPPSAPTGFRFL